MVRRTGACVALALVLAVPTACASSSGADVVVAAAAAAVLQAAPGGSGPVMAGVDHAVVVERRATVVSIDVLEGAMVHRGQQLMSVYTIGDSGIVGTAVNQLRADENELTSVRARDGAAAATTIGLLGRVAHDRQVLTDLQSLPTSITAPADGRVSGLTIQVGSELTRTDVVMHVIDNATVKVTVPVSASYRQLINAGQPAMLSIPGGSGRTFPSTVASVGDTAAGAAAKVANKAATAVLVDPNAVPVTITLTNPSTALALGSTAYVSFPIRRAAPVAVNALAVLGSDQQPFVFVVKDGRAQQRSVVLGITDGSSTEIISGVAVGEQVVISGGHELVDGAPVHTAESGTT